MKQKIKSIGFTQDDFSNGDMGGCLSCGELAYGVEPDARKYECEVCGEHSVYGAEELLLMGKAHIQDDDVEFED